MTNSPHDRRRKLARIAAALDRLAETMIDEDDEARLVDAKILIRESYDAIPGKAQTLDEMMEFVSKMDNKDRRRRKV